MKTIISIFSYNKSATIVKCIDSVLSEVLPNDVVIVYDDCSTDNTVNIIKENFNVGANLNLIIGARNMGISFCRNYILDKYPDNFIMFLDGDDFWKPGHRILLEKYKTFSSIVHSNGVGSPNSLAQVKSLSPSVFRLNMSNSIFFNHRECAVRFKNINYGEDLIFWLQMSKELSILSLGNNTTSITSNRNRSTEYIKKIILLINLVKFRVFISWAIKRFWT